MKSAKFLLSLGIPKLTMKKGSAKRKLDSSVNATPRKSKVKALPVLDLDEYDSEIQNEPVDQLNTYDEVLTAMEESGITSSDSTRTQTVPRTHTVTQTVPRTHTVTQTVPKTHTVSVPMTQTDITFYSDSTQDTHSDSTYDTDRDIAFYSDSTNDTHSDSTYDTDRDITCYRSIYLCTSMVTRIEEAKELSHEAYLGYTSRENIETCRSQEKKLTRAEEDNVPGPNSPEVPESVDEVVLQEDGSEFAMQSAQEAIPLAG
ncbi:unnamed protein product [Mytilus edulis]|uniref:Uncharacterized protein n=1 Tax=Mytilus edulis TaxID=6550 RepID=A0A8S3TRQ1_MYTED|nr:unnamed protein product [Mytilus edulis]